MASSGVRLRKPARTDDKPLLAHPQLQRRSLGADGKTYFLGTTVPVVSQREDLLPWHHGCPFTLRGIS